MKSKQEQIDKLTELNEELENYFSNTMIPQLFVDANLILRKFTPPAKKQFTLKEEHIGMTLHDIAAYFKFSTIIEDIQFVIATGKILEKEIQTTDLYWYQMNILPYHVRKENKTNGVILTFMDVTARIKDLREQERLIAEHELLLDTIAHDIKNPILGISLTADLISGPFGENREQLPLLLENLKNSVVQIKKVVSDLTESRWQKHRHQATEELLDLKDIVKDVRLILAPQIIESKAIIKEEIGVSDITFVKRKLRSIVYNLVSNAIKYTPVDRRPEIGIKIYEDKGYMVLRVSDNGIGMTKEQQNIIFDKFRRAELTVEGSGVGLYLVNSTVAHAGGKVTVESEPGKGAVFHVFLKHDTKPAAAP